MNWFAARSLSSTSAESVDRCRKIAHCGCCAGPCVNKEDNCVDWAKKGECTKNPTFMLRSCRRSCTSCGKKQTQVKQLKISESFLSCLDLLQFGFDKKHHQIEPAGREGGRTSSIRKCLRMLIGQLCSTPKSGPFQFSTAASPKIV